MTLVVSWQFLMCDCIRVFCDPPLYSWERPTSTAEKWAKKEEEQGPHKTCCCGPPQVLNLFFLLVVFFFFLYASRSGLVIFFQHSYPVFLFYPSTFVFLCCRQMLKHKRWDQVLVQLTKGSITPRKTLGKEEWDTSPVECYGFAKSVRSRESADPNWKTSGGSCRITSYFVPMLIHHKVKKNPSFPCQLWMCWLQLLVLDSWVSLQ